MIIREIEPRDLPQLIELEKQLWSFFDGLSSEERSSEEITARNQKIEQGFALNLTGPNPVLKGVVIEENNNLVGHLLYSIGFDPYGHSYNRIATFISLFVKEEYRNKGSLRLMRQGARSAKDNGCKEAFLVVWNKNEHAQKLYEMAKFKPNHSDLIWMNKKI